MKTVRPFGFTWSCFSPEVLLIFPIDLMLRNLSGGIVLKVHEASFIVFEAMYRWSHSLATPPTSPKVLTGFVVVSLHDSKVQGRGRLRDGPLSLGGVAFGAA